MIPLLLTLVLAQSRTFEAVDIRDSTLQVTITAQRETVTIVVQPPVDARVQSIRMDVPRPRTWPEPTTRVPLPKRGVRLTFRHPHALYAFDIVLDDGRRYLAEVDPSSGVTRVLQAPDRATPERATPEPLRTRRVTY